MPELRGSDLAAVTEQLGREPLTEFAVLARCGSGHPLVIRNHPVDRSGEPFPTLYWLTCADAVASVSRLESEGWIKRLADRAREDRGFGVALEEAHRAYAEERGRWAPQARRWGGVGGSRTGVKCLHAHYANHVAGGKDPVGSWVAGRVEPVHEQEDRSGRVAAVDMGTNSIRLLVAEPRDDDLFELGRDMVITRLGQGVDRTGRLNRAAIRRTMDVLERYVRRARALGVRRVRVGATSAVRDAGDLRLIDEAVSSLTGSTPEVLSGDREADLGFLGSTAGLDRPGPFLVFDIGGGSTEVVLGEEAPTASVSVDLGSVRITERVAPADPPTEENLRAMRRLAAEGFSQAERVVPAGKAATMIGLAGTTTTVQAIALGLPRYDPEAIHRSVLTRPAAEAVTERLAGMTVVERAAIPVMAPGREDVIVAGSVILLEILDRWGFRECLVSERDLLDGLALEMVRSDTDR